jgi:hypothetical protein
MDAHYIIPEKLANDILKYLATRPYGEVAEYIDGLRKLTKVETVGK